MSFFKRILNANVMFKSDFLERRMYIPARIGDLEEEIDSRTSSSSEATTREDKQFLLPSTKRTEQSVLIKRISSISLSFLSLQTLVIVLLASTSVVSVLYFVEHLTVRFPGQSTSPVTVSASNNLIAFEKPCGDTSEEARARGCYFDVMTFLWLPEQCYDQDLINDFLALHNWEYYQDQNLSMPVSLTQAMTGEYALLYVSHEYHVRHCTLVWRKMHRALLSPLGLAAVDGYMAGYAHTLHCEHMLLDWRDRPFELINTGLVRQFPSCGMFMR